MEMGREGELNGIGKGRKTRFKVEEKEGEC